MIINPIRVLKVFARFLLLMTPFLIFIFVLSAGTELYVRDIPLDIDNLGRLREFWPAILRNMLPSLLGMLIAYWLAARFVNSLYSLEKLGEGFGFLWRWRFGQARFSPYQRIQQGKIDKGEDGVLTHIGGPGQLVVYHDSVAVLSRAGRVTRLEGPKFPTLEPFEKVYRAIDLQPKRAEKEFTAMTREGIPISCKVDIRYQIKRSEHPPTHEWPFPVFEHSVLTAATSTWKCEPHISEDGELDWEELLTFAPMGILRSILARYSLNELIQPMGWEGDDQPYRQRISRELERRLRPAARDLGAQVLSLDLGDIEIQDDGVTKQWLEAWRTKWEGQMVRRRAEGEAEAITQIGTAKAQAQAETVVALTQSLQSLVGDADALQRRLGLMRIVAMLSHMSQDPQTQPFLPVETLHDLIALQDMVEGIAEQ